MINPIEYCINTNKTSVLRQYTGDLFKLIELNGFYVTYNLYSI